jgi:hypothetical protein
MQRKGMLHRSKEVPEAGLIAPRLSHIDGAFGVSARLDSLGLIRKGRVRVLTLRGT